MLAPQHHPFPRQYQMYQNKLITIISPYTGEQFKIELSGEEGEFRDLLATLLNIDPSNIKGLKDSFGNYYTISCALKDPYIFANGNNLFSLVLNLSNNNFNKYKQLSNSYNKNLLYNINNNYHNRTEYNEIYIGNRKNKLIDDNSDYKNKKQIRKYSTLIKKLIPAINRNFKEEEDSHFEPESSYFDEWSLGQQAKFQKNLEKLKNNFNKEQMNILRELLKMENITIINFFKIYEKSKNKKDLIKNLTLLSKKYQKKLQKVSEDEEESEESISSEDNEKEKKIKKKKNKKNKNKMFSDSSESSSHPPLKNQKKVHHHKKHSSSESQSDNNSDTSNKSNEESENNEEEEENEEESEEKKHNFPIKCSNLTELINAIKNELDDTIDLYCLFSNEIDFIKKTETQKTQLIKDEFDIKDFTLTENSFELIKKYYENILKKVIMKDLSKEEKELLQKLIKKKNKSIKLRFKALLRHNNYEYLITDIKECLNDKLKKKKHKNKSDGEERQINLEEKESMSINSNSNNDNENEGEEEYVMGESTKSIRKNERMAKNNKNNKKDQGSQKSKSKDDESGGQIKLFQMEDSSVDDSESKKNNDENGKKESEKEKTSKKNGETNKDEGFLTVINKLKDEGKLDITEKEINILENEFKNKSEKLLSIWEIYQIELEEDDFIESIKFILKALNKNNDYNLNDNNNKENNENENNNDNSNNNDGEKDKPYAKEIFAGLKGVKYGKKGNKKIINILLKNKIFTKEEMRNIEEDLDQNNQFVLGTFELLYVTMNIEDFVENLNIRLHLPEGESGQNQNSALPIDDEKYNQIRNNLENIVKSLSEEDQNKIRELFEKKDINLLNILESEVNDIEKAKKSILNFLGKN